MDRAGRAGGGAPASSSARGRGARPAGVRSGFARGLHLATWDGESTWGYDAELECYWAELRRGSDGPPGEGSLRIGPEHLISTVTGLARAVAFAVEVADVDVYLALTDRAAEPVRAAARPGSRDRRLQRPIAEHDVA